MNLAEEFPITSSSPCPFSNYIMNAMLWGIRVENHPSSAAGYLSCPNNAFRFHFAETFVAKVLKLDIKPKIVFHGKNEVKAEAARRSGNRLFAGGDLPGALAAYNESIVLATLKDKGCIVLALGNRSAVFFRMERYAECIRDIDQAVMLGYPLESVKKLLMRKAQAFLALSQPLAAVFVLKKEGRLLEVCAGGTEEICQLDGDLKDYADLLALALRKQKDEDESACCSPDLDVKTKYPTGWDKEEESKMLKLRDGSGKMFSYLSSMASFHPSCDARKRSETFVANQDLKAGDVLLKERAFVSVVDKRALLTNCHACLCWTDAPFPCSKCSSVVFCSPACANGPKATLHARECSFWQTVCLSDEEERRNPMGLMVGLVQFHQNILLALRMMLTKSTEDLLALVNPQWKTISEQLPKLRKGRYQGDELLHAVWLTSIAGGSEKIGAFRGEMSPRVAFIAVYLVKLLETEYLSGITLSVQARCSIGALAMHALVACDRYRDFFEEMLGPSLEYPVTSATALHPIFSQFGKSCNANLIGVYYGDVLVLRARRPIRKGEALTTPYSIENFTSVPREERQIALKEQGYDGCKCRACEENWPEVDSLMEECLEGSCKFKCPFCSHVLGTFGTVLEHPERLLEGCPKCKASGNILHSAVTAVLDWFPRGTDTTAPWLPADTVDELLAAIQTAGTICVEPSLVLSLADVLLEKAVRRSGHKRFDNLIPLL